jgi:SAM-dependent methyltransferase
MDYIDVPTVDYTPSLDWEETVRNATLILSTKLKIAGKTHGRFLDVGCSEGIYLAAGAALGWTAVGVEIDAAKLQRAKERNLDARAIDLADPSLSMAPFDFILIRHVIEHVPDFVGLIRSAARFLTPDGVLCIECPNQGSLGGLISRRRVVGNRYLGELYPPTHIHAFEKVAFKKLSGKLALDCTKIVTYTMADPKWAIASFHKNSVSKRWIKRLISRLGAGGNIAAFYKRCDLR